MFALDRIDDPVLERMVWKLKIPTSKRPKYLSDFANV
jgi:hypothetical protein